MRLSGSPAPPEASPRGHSRLGDRVARTARRRAWQSVRQRRDPGPSCRGLQRPCAPQERVASAYWSCEFFLASSSLLLVLGFEEGDVATQRRAHGGPAEASGSSEAKNQPRLRVLYVGGNYDKNLKSR